MPNFLIIMTDQQQAQTIESNSQCLTPNIDRLAKEGARFERAYTPCPVCSPARASLFCGYYPHEHGKLTVVHSKPAINLTNSKPMRFFTECLKEKNYRQVHVGRWHVTPDEAPSIAGYDEVFTVKDAIKARLDAGLSEHFFAPDTVTDPVYLKRQGWEDWPVSGILNEPTELTLDGWIGQTSIDQLQELCNGKDNWHLTVSFYNPHDPYACPAEYADLYDPQQISKPASWDDNLEDKPGLYRRQRRELWDKISWPDQAKCTARYWGACTMVDDYIGKLLKILDDSGQADDTVVIFTSDHGDMMAAHGLFLKGILPFEEAWRIPMVIRWPNRIKAQGPVNDRFVSLLDIAPTILDAAGLQPWEDAHGSPLHQILEDDVPKQRKSFLGEFHGGEYYYTQRVLWSERYKYVFNTFDEDELYDLQEDPHEIHNIANTPNAALLKEKLWALYWNKHEQTRDFLNLNYPNIALFPVGPNLT